MVPGVPESRTTAKTNAFLFSRVTVLHLKSKLLASVEAMFPPANTPEQPGAGKSRFPLDSGPQCAARPANGLASVTFRFPPTYGAGRNLAGDG